MLGQQFCADVAMTGCSDVPFWSRSGGQATGKGWVAAVNADSSDLTVRELGTRHICCDLSVPAVNPRVILDGLTVKEEMGQS